MWAFAGLCVGVLLGAGAHILGTWDACPQKACVGSANVVPVTDRQYFDTALARIESAQKSIHIASFEMKHYDSRPSSKMNRLVRQLVYAKERGVDVKVVTDEYSRENNAHSMLAENGVPIRLDGRDQTLHAKLIIVDGKVVLLGSTNLSFFGLEKNREANVMIDDEAVAQSFERYFKDVWESSEDFKP